MLIEIIDPLQTGSVADTVYVYESDL